MLGILGWLVVEHHICNNRFTPRTHPLYKREGLLDLSSLEAICSQCSYHDGASHFVNVAHSSEIKANYRNNFAASCSLTSFLFSQFSDTVSYSQSPASTYRISSPPTYLICPDPQQQITFTGSPKPCSCLNQCWGARSPSQSP